MKAAKLLLAQVCFLAFGSAFGQVPRDYEDGDIIFQESQSHQSQAIREATNSRWSHVGILVFEEGKWYVAEAVQPVRLTRMDSFVARGKNKSYRIYRAPGLKTHQRQELRRQIKMLLGKHYDIYFEWSDDLIYCSELVYKAFLRSTGMEIGVVQKFRDLRLDGPYVQELIQRRIRDRGRILDLDEPIVTPASQLEDPKLELIDRSEE